MTSLSGSRVEGEGATEVSITRILYSPRSLVFQMWTEPKHLARWWGPSSFTNPICELDPRPGGAIRIVMRSPDGAEFPMSGKFHETIDPERIIFTAVAEDNQGQALLEVLTTVTFADQGDKTKLTLHAIGSALVPVAAEMLKGMEQGWTQALRDWPNLSRPVGANHEESGSRRENRSLRS